MVPDRPQAQKQHAAAAGQRQHGHAAASPATTPLSIYDWSFVPGDNARWAFANVGGTTNTSAADPLRPRQPYVAARARLRPAERHRQQRHGYVGRPVRHCRRLPLRQRELQRRDLARPAAEREPPSRVCRQGAAELGQRWGAVHTGAESGMSWGFKHDVCGLDYCGRFAPTLVDGSLFPSFVLFFFSFFFELIDDRPARFSRHASSLFIFSTAHHRPFSRFIFLCQSLGLSSGRHAQSCGIHSLPA